MLSKYGIAQIIFVLIFQMFKIIPCTCVMLRNKAYSSPISMILKDSQTGIFECFFYWNIRHYPGHYTLDIIGVVLISFMLTLNIFHTLF